MNDRFKFRMWIESQERMITDVTGFVIDTNKEKIRVFRMNPNMRDGMSSELFMLADVTIEQCTGRDDMNGKLAYEGDIIETYWLGEPCQLVLFYDTFLLCFRLQPICSDKEEDVCEFTAREDFIILGNIHENHELLEA